MVLSQLDKHDKVFQMALFKHVLADDALRVHNRFIFTTEESERTGERRGIIDRFEEHAIGKISEAYERIVFSSRIQAEYENVDQLYSDLRSLVKTCA